MNPSLKKLIEITKELLGGKYPSAEFAFLAGSYVRGEATAFSDLDIIVIFSDLPNAFRESSYFQKFPVETFVHTPETLNYFFETDATRGIPSLPQMVAEGIAVPSETELSNKLKSLANEILQNPPKISKQKLDQMRYGITNLIDDLREPRSKQELTATATELYNELADFYFRSKGLWSAKNKGIPRVLKKNDPELCRVYCESFEDLFVSGNQEKVIELTEKILNPHGGYLFEGVKLDAPKDWRKSFE